MINNTLIPFIHNTYSTKVGMGVGLVTGLTAIESALNVFKSLGAIWKRETRTEGLQSFSINLCSVALYGALFANVIPVSQKITAVAFAVYAMIECDQPDAYLMAKIVGRITRIPIDAVKRLIRSIVDKIFDTLNYIQRKLPKAMKVPYGVVFIAAGSSIYGCYKLWLWYKRTLYCSLGFRGSL